VVDGACSSHGSQEAKGQMKTQDPNIVSKATPPMTSLPHTRPRLLKDPLPPNSATGW
jgi:hypothetical protein